jgi:hypothetical protein
VFANDSTDGYLEIVGTQTSAVSVSYGRLTQVVAPVTNMRTFDLADNDAIDSLEEGDQELKFETQTELKVSMSYHAGVIDEGQAGKFMSKMSSYLNDPELLLI